MSILKIQPIATDKKNIKSNEMMDQHIIPKHPFSALFVGRSNSGKSVLLLNLLVKDEFYRQYFDMIFLFTESPDDSFDVLEMKENHIFLEHKTWDKKLETIYDNQKKIIDDKGISKSPRVLLIFEDIQNFSSWMKKSPFFTKCFIANRHYGISTMMTAQSWTKTPRICRINANQIYYFAGSQSENELLANEYAHPDLSHKKMLELISDATKPTYSFLNINNRLEWSKRFKKNLDEQYNF